MSAMGWWTRLSPGARRAVLVIAVALLAAGTAFALMGRGRGSGPRGQARPDSAAAGAMAGMDMSAGGEVRLTPEQVRQFGVTFGTAEQRTLSDEVRTVGVVAFDESRQAQVAPKFGGYVERMYVDITGQPVRRGQPLLEVYSPELVAAEQELLVAARLQATMGQGSVPGVPAGQADLVGAARDRLRLWDVPDAEIREVLRSGRARRTTTLYSPASGVVVEKKVLRGQAFQAGTPLYTIADLSVVWVEAELREGDAGMVRPGSTATVELSAFPGRPLSGVVDYVYPTLQAEARTLKARIRLPNTDGRLKPGMYAAVRLSAPGRATLTVPASAVVRTGVRSLVFTDAGGGRLQPREVEVGRVSGDYAEVLSGVEPGQRVVTSAQFLLDSESNLGEVMRGMAGMDGSGAKTGAPATVPAAAPGGMQDRGADMRGMPGMATPPRPR